MAKLRILRRWADRLGACRRRFPSRRAAMSEKPCQREQPRRHRGVGAHAAPRRRDSRAEQPRLVASDLLAVVAYANLPASLSPTTMLMSRAKSRSNDFKVR
jgi:hypothetical protein